MSPRNSPRVDRRRRVLVDESRNDEYLIGKPRIFRGDSDAPPCRYNSLALQSLQAPIVRYLPLRRYHLLVWFLVGLLPIAGLAVLHVWQPTMESDLASGGTEALVLGNRGSFASWWASSSLAFSVLVILGIYSVRRHRRDDHRGRFTVWRLGILAAVVASMEATTGFHETLQAFGEKIGGARQSFWVVAYVIFFGAILIRLGLEMAVSRLALTSLLIASSCYLWAVVVEVNPAEIGNVELIRLSQQVALLLGHHGILFSLVAYAREIVLEAMGVKTREVTPAKATSKTAKRAPKEAKEEQPKLRVAAPGEDAEVAPKPSKPKQSNPPNLSVHAGEEDDAVAEPNPKLSKAERRRQRKEKRRRAA